MAQPDNKPKAPAKILIRAVYGLMTHPFIEDKAFNVDTITPVDEIDDFLKVQIEAGKLEVV